MFFDEARIVVQAGDGGKGCCSFRREKFEPMGGPNGGNGGAGGNVLLVGSGDVDNLVAFHFQPNWSGERGGHGLGSDCHGRRGADCVLRAPLGTVVLEKDSGRKVGEILSEGETLTLCKGGRGGWGNLHFKSSTNRAPRRADPGEPGEKGEFLLVLKIIADVGLVGYPNAGKSTLLGRLTNSRTRVAPYPFTTLNPHIGILEFEGGYDRLSLADIPGLIEGASENRGLGHRFLRHVERCRLLLFLVDMAGIDGRAPLEDFRSLEKELRLYDPALLEKERIVVANKMDEEGAEENLEAFRRAVSDPVVSVSCTEGTGLDELRRELRERVRRLPPEVPGETASPDPAGEASAAPDPKPGVAGDP